MNNNAKRVLSMVLCVLMCVSMLTAIVLPVSAETTKTVADPYEKVTTIPGTNEPTENVVFVDPAWSRTPKLDANNQFEYKYVGNGKTYKLTWGVNAFATIPSLYSNMLAYSEKWVSSPSSYSQDFVVLFAPGEYNAFTNYVVLKYPITTPSPSIDELLNVYMLGAKAGQNPVSDARDTKAEAKAIQNDRSVNTAKESVITNFFWFPIRSNCVIDGFAATKNASFGSNNGSQFDNVTIKNLYVTGLTNPKNNKLFAGSDTINATTNGMDHYHRRIMWEFENCYLDFNTNTSVSSYDRDNFGDRKDNNVILSNKIVFDNCYISNTSSNDDFKFYLAPERQSAANAASDFFGDYAKSPEITFKNSIVNECVSKGLFIFDNTSNYFTSYSKGGEGQVKINFVNNKIFDTVSTSYTNTLIRFTGWVDGDDAANNVISFNCTGNTFSISKERETALTENNYIFDFSGSDDTDTETQVTASLLNHFTIKDNVFKFSGNQNVFLDPGSANESNLGLDLSGNLFVDNDGNVLSGPGVKNFSEGYMSVQSDLYVSAAMKGGVRETLSVKDVKDGALLYNYIQLNSTGKNFLGAVTLLLENGKEYTADENLFTFGDDKVTFEGVYSDEACTQKVEKLTQDMFANNAKYFLKASYSEEGTKTTVVYALNSPMEYVVVTPEGSSSDQTKTYEFNGSPYANGVKSDDGVTAKFFTDIADAIDEVDTTLAGEQKDANSSALAKATTATVFSLDSVILLTPGTYNVGNVAAKKALAIVGPKFSVSPYDSQKNSEGKLAEGRGISAEEEAILSGTFNNNFGETGEASANITICGIVWTSTEGALIEFTNQTDIRKSDYQIATLKNCIFSTLAKDGIITTNGLTEDSNLAVDIRVQDCVYYQPDSKRETDHLFVDALAYRKVIENFSVISKNCWVPGVLANDATINNTAWLTQNDATPVIENTNYYYAEHIKGELIVDEFPVSCAKEGKGHYNCNCGEKLMEDDVVIPAAPHTPDKLIVVDTKPTCSTTGIGHKDCLVCKQTIRSNIIIPADELAHIWESEYTVDEEPTCTRSGVMSIHCEVCDTFKPGSVIRMSKAEHPWETTYTVDTASTCTVKGVESIHCSVCDAIKEGSARALPLKAHVWETEYTIDKEPSCSAEGSKSYHCKDCDTIFDKSVTSIPKTEHVWNSEATVDTPATCTKDGSASYHCKNCDATKDPYILPATGHEKKTDVFVVIPTYQKGGVAATVCEACGTEFDRWNVSKLEGKLAYKVFKDVEKSDWFYKNDSINFVYNTDLMQGTGKATFSPDATLTRGMFVTILGRLHGVSSAKKTTKFTDVQKSAYYSGYIAWAAKNGIVSGTSATTFAPDAPVTREQICAILYRYCDFADITLENVNDKVTFKDAKSISSYAKTAVAACQRSGLVNGEKSGSGYAFRPKDTASRAEAATIIRSLCYEYIIK